MTAKSTERSPGHEKGSAEPIVREEIGNLLAGGVDEGANILSSLAELGVRYVAQRALEQEQTDHLGRGRYEPADRLGLRNGYEGRKVDSRGPGRAARPAGPRRWGAVPIQANRVPEGNSGVLERLVSEMYARSLSTRDVEDAFRDATGELVISRSAVSEITDQLWEDYQAFRSRDLSGIELVYLFRHDVARRRGDRPGEEVRRRQGRRAMGTRADRLTF